MPIAWNEIRSRAYAFAKEWENETRERSEAQSFWNAFLYIFNVNRRRCATFEYSIKKLSGNTGFIDLFWPGTLLVEHKSRGEDLVAAYTQASDYFASLEDAELPRFVLVSDFEHFHLYNMDEGGCTVTHFTLDHLVENITHFGFIAGYEVVDIEPEDPINIEAVEKMAKLYDQLKEAGYTGHDLQVYLVRLLFCLFAEDTGIFNRNLFHDLLLNFTSPDGSDLGAIINQLFETLNTPRENRNQLLADHFDEFDYVNGALFAERLSFAGFNSQMRTLLLEASKLDWSKISPAIFGSLFQYVMNPEERRHLGAHYTSEANIMKVIRPLFLDNLHEEFEQVKRRKNRAELRRFHEKLARLEFLDPACGCGNFLVIAYRELRLLELEVLKETYANQLVLDINNIMLIDVDQFYGIEIEEFPAQIAQVALWLTDHQMNIKVSEAFGKYFVRLPLQKSATIVTANALTTPWENVVKKEELSFILGNPPFVGSKYQSQEQKEALSTVIGHISSSGILDLVTGWYILAANYIKDTNIAVGFVSTNSITQGEQVHVLWPELIENSGIVINFAHRTFQWNSEARGKAAVHCVIIGFALQPATNKYLYEYDTPTSEPQEVRVATINPHLENTTFVALPNRRDPLCDVPKAGIGNKPIDDGNYLFTSQEKEEFLALEPAAAPYFRKWIGAQEFLNGKERWCLWLGNVPPQDLRRLPKCLERVEAVRQFRYKSKSGPTNKIADTPTRFHVENMPKSKYLVVPKVSSERRNHIPIGYMPSEVLASDLVHIIPNANLFHFGMLSSTMHMAWVRYVAGRLKNDYRYSIQVVYNNYPWPQKASSKQKAIVEKASQTILDIRANYPESTLADLYDPRTTPSDLTKAHKNLDKAVDLCYRPQPFTTELNRVGFLLELYQKLNTT